LKNYRRKSRQRKQNKKEKEEKEQKEQQKEEKTQQNEDSMQDNTEVKEAAQTRGRSRVSRSVLGNGRIHSMCVPCLSHCFRLVLLTMSEWAVLFLPHTTIL
jgi:hypothetical protein